MDGNIGPAPIPLLNANVIIKAHSVLPKTMTRRNNINSEDKVCIK